MEYNEARLVVQIADALKRGDLAEAAPWTTARRIDDAISAGRRPTRANTTAIARLADRLGAFEKGTGPNPNSRPMATLVIAIRTRGDEARSISANPPLLKLR